MNKATLALCAILATAACKAFADEARMEWVTRDADGTPASYVQLQPTTDPSSVMELEFYNTQVHGDDTDFTLLFEGVSVKVYMQWNCNAADECLTIIPEPGYRAVPPEISVAETEIETVLIQQYLGF